MATNLTQLREIVLLAEGTLPQPCLIISDCLVIALALWSSVGDPSDIADDQLSWGKGKEKTQDHTNFSNRYQHSGVFPPLSLRRER